MLEAIFTTSLSLRVITITSGPPTPISPAASNSVNAIVALKEQMSIQIKLICPKVME